MWGLRLTENLNREDLKMRGCEVWGWLRIWAGRFEDERMWGGKKKRINLLYSFWPYRFFFPYRFTGFRHSIIIKQTWRGSCTCGSDWESTLGPTCWTQLRIFFPSLGGISMAEWSVGDGVWSWFSGNFCYRFCYRFVSRRFSQSVVRGT